MRTKRPRTILGSTIVVCCFSTSSRRLKTALARAALRPAVPTVVLDTMTQQGNSRDEISATDCL
jgi:hypothetical protein